MEPIAVGSTVKLAVLAALEQEVEKGRLSWTSIVDLKPEWKSFPSGILREWPDGSPLTLHTLAALTIALSDNTESFRAGGSEGGSRPEPAQEPRRQVVGRGTVRAMSSYPRGREFLPRDRR